MSGDLLSLLLWVLGWNLMWLLVWVKSWGPFVILGLKPYVTPCLSHVLRTFCDSQFETLSDSGVMSWGPFVILGLKPYVTLCLSHVLGTFCDSFCESWVGTLCDSLFESSPGRVLGTFCDSFCESWFETFSDSLFKLSLKPLGDFFSSLLWDLLCFLVWDLKCKEHVNLQKTIVRTRHKIDQRNGEMGPLVLYPEFFIDIQNVTLAFFFKPFNL